MIPTQTLRAFQQDLRAGMTIEDACREYNITFKQAFEHMPAVSERPKKPYKKRHNGKSSGERNILQRNKHFYVRKCINKKTLMFGTYSSLEDAIAIRDYCDRYGWKQRKVDEYCRILGIVRCTGHVNQKVRYH